MGMDAGDMKERLDKRIAELEAALRPFAEAADRFGIDGKDLAVARDVLRKSDQKQKEEFDSRKVN